MYTKTVKLSITPEQRSAKGWMTMDNFIFYSPTCFVFGRDTESQTGSLVKRFGGRQGSISGFVTLNEDDCARIYRAMF